MGRALGHAPSLLLVTWCFGASNAIDRIDGLLMRAELGHARPGWAWEVVRPFVVESWLGFWLWVLASGAVSGALVWWIGGWWYGVRLRWSGAMDLDKRLARITFVYSSFVFTGPAILLAIGKTVAYPSYAVAYAADEWFSVGFLLFPFWSIVTSYVGVRTLFAVARWKAITWFIVLPAMAYGITLGVIVALFAFLSGKASS